MIQHYSRFKLEKFSTKEKNTKTYDNEHIFAFDIETTSYIVLDDEVRVAQYYDNLNKEEQEQCIKQANMYVWQLSINEQVYYGRTWSELKEFIEIIDSINELKKIIWIHNASFEFQFLQSVFNFTKVFARKSRKVMKCEFEEYNIEIRCTYVLTNLSLSQIAKSYNLPVKKLKGDLDYNKLRHSMTHLYKNEFKYIENDCLIIYYYIKNIELKKYKYINEIPLTLTGHVRGDLKMIVQKNSNYKRKTRKAINLDPHVYNLLLLAYWGGYNHANWIYVDMVLKNLDSFDFTSSYPFCLSVEKYPMSKFTKCNITKKEDMLTRFAYLLKVRFENIECKYTNTFISKSKCTYLEDFEDDNGRIMSASVLEIVCTDVDFNIIYEAYMTENSTCIFLEAYYAAYDYLPIELVNFTLEKYILKTQYKDVEGKKIEYAHEKSNFNSIYGMMCTRTIRNLVEYDYKKGGWQDEELMNNEEILKQLEDDEKNAFLSFAWGVWITAYARKNILGLVKVYDKYCVYVDTDSLKLLEGYDVKFIQDYNKDVEEKIKKVCSIRDIPFERFNPVDCKGIPHLMGLLEKEKPLSEFITQGAKKYARRYKDSGKIEITVSGVPKSGVVALNNDLNKFKDNLIFKNKTTGKLSIEYKDKQETCLMQDYEGYTYTVNDTSGACLLPASYTLGKAPEYAALTSDNVSRRNMYNETI